MVNIFTLRIPQLRNIVRQLGLCLSTKHQCCKRRVRPLLVLLESCVLLTQNTVPPIKCNSLILDVVEETGLNEDADITVSQFSFAGLS